jgi:hypothetical protein
MNYYGISKNTFLIKITSVIEYSLILYYITLFIKKFLILEIIISVEW